MSNIDGSLMMGFDFEQLSTNRNYTAMERIHSISHFCANDGPRPKPLPSNYPYTGWFDFYCRGRFEEAKIYFDAKNGIYALKKEIAVSASPPHYALFFQEAQVGSIHDYTMFKYNYQCYLNYLLKTPDEKNLIHSDANDPNWAILGDRGYIGPDTDTPDLRRVKMVKNSSFQSEIDRNAELGRIRVPIECWFGRLKKLWKFARETYK